MRRLCFLVFPFVMILACATNRTPEGGPVASHFVVGQQWSYATRAQDTGSTVVVLRLEVHEELGTIVHISVNGVRIRNPAAPGSYTDTVSHVPIAAESLQGSVTELLQASHPVHEFEEGYSHWKAAFDSGNAGIFTISVSEVVEFLEQSLQQGS